MMCPHILAEPPLSLLATVTALSWGRGGTGTWGALELIHP